MLNAELLDFVCHFLEVDHFLLQNVLQEHDDQSHHPLLVDLVLVGLRLRVRSLTTLANAILKEELDELRGELHVVLQPIEDFEKVGRELHTDEHVVVFGDLDRVRHAVEELDSDALVID